MHTEPTSFLTRQYFCALVLLSLLALLGFVSMRLNSESYGSASDIFISSGQIRSRSQRIALLAQRLVLTPDPSRRSDLRSQILEESERLEESLQTHRDAYGRVHPGGQRDPKPHAPSGLSPELDGVLRGITAHAKALAAAEDAALDRENPHLARILVATEGDPFAELEEVTLSYQDLLEREHKRQVRLAAGVFGATLIVLLAIGIFVFGPILRRLRQEMDRLSAGKATLEQRVELRTRKLAESDKQVRVEIAERERAEDALRESEACFRNLVESTSDILWEVDREGRYTYCSPNIQPILGYDPKEVIGKTPFDLMPPEEGKRMKERFAEIARRSAPFSLLSHEVVHKDGGLGILETSGSPVFDADGRLKGYRGVDRDITERKQIEEALRQREEQLQRSQRMEAIGRLAGGVAHDFNNILTAITGHGACIRERLGDDHPAAPDVFEIEQSAGRAAALVRQLLAFGGRQVLTPKILDLGVVIADMTKMLRRVIGEDIDLVTRPASDLGLVKADPCQIEQVILNLALNARDAMPEGGCLTIDTSNVEIDPDREPHPFGLDPGRYVLFSVTDTGFGMDEVTLSLAFEPFFTTKEQGKGTGMGLSSVHGIVNQSGGAIFCMSEPGRGARFEIYLPRVEGQVPAEPRPTPSPEPGGGSETILIVEDEEAVRSLVHKILEIRGYTVLEASQGDEALQISQGYPGSIDLMLTDVVMPRMSGPELAGRIAETRPEMKVIFMSGYTDEDMDKHGVSGSGPAFVQKPFTPDELWDKVREVLDSTEASRPTAVASGQVDPTC